MAEYTHFPKYSVTSTHVVVNVDLSRYGQAFAEAQQWLGERILQDCRARMPLLTGSLQQRSHTEEGGKRVVFPGPYARFQNGGLVMVDPVTGSPWARPGVKKVLTDRLLRYSQPAATSHWFDAAKAEYKDAWIAEVQRRITGGR